MKPINLINRLKVVSLGSALAVLMTSNLASATPITGLFLDDVRCDVVSPTLLRDELGNVPPFPVNEGIAFQSSAVNFTVCVANDGVANDWLVKITNTSGIAYRDLFFVCDLTGTVGNADGVVEDVVGAPGVFTDAFRIDGTVTPGANSNLLFESGLADEIFSPNESWGFAVSNFNPSNGGGAGTPPIFITPGAFAGSALASAGNASILATPVPEPGKAGLMLAIGAFFLMQRPLRQKLWEAPKTM
jgi:hypothetical protein